MIPPYEVVIFDEAHLLEETANNYFSIQVSSYRLFELFRDISWEMGAARSTDSSLTSSLQSLGKLSTHFFEMFPFSDRRQRLLSEAISGEIHQRWLQLSQALEQLITDLFRHQDLSEGLSACHRRAQEVHQSLELILNQSDANYVYWYETRGKGKFLWASPVQVAPILQEHLFHRQMPFIFTSATLAVGNNLDFFKNRLGLSPETAGLILDTPFSYREQTVIYLPKHLPLPDSPNFVEAVTEEVAAILEETGRAGIHPLHQPSQSKRGLFPAVPSGTIQTAGAGRTAKGHSAQAFPRGYLFGAARHRLLLAGRGYAGRDLELCDH